ncbi:MAG: glycosyltransferase family 2 protein [Phycisphaerales bacterium]|nr:glycosyltransferase family 2 protein [Phycisphaerales bacterium]
MGGPAISFVVAAFNAEKTVERTIQSLREQTRGDWEAIVIDDGSTDRTAAICRAVGDPRLRLVTQANSGVSVARNRGVELATGEAICFLDADDWVEPTFSQVMMAMLGGTDADLAACSFRMAGARGEDLSWETTLSLADVAPAKLIEFNPLCIGGVVVRRSTLLANIKADGPAFNRESRHEDWELWLRLIARGARWGGVSPEPLFHYRIVPGSRTSDVDGLWRDGRRIIAKFGPPASQQEAIQRRWTLRNLARAVARGDAALAEIMLWEPGELTEADLGILCGSLRWAFQREESIGPMQAPHHAAAWARKVEAIIGFDPVGTTAAARMMLGAGEVVAWARVAQAALAELKAGERLVVYGMGRNGREAWKRLREIGSTAVWMDDSPSVQADGPRVHLADLTASDLVLVTPDERAGMLARLKAAAVGRVLLPEHLLGVINLGRAPRAGRRAAR